MTTIADPSENAASRSRHPGADASPAAQRWLAASLGSAARTAGGSEKLHLSVRGAIARAPGAKWMEWVGRQTINEDGIGFVWRARIRIAGNVWVDAEDRLDDRGGFGGARLFGLIPVGSARGPEVTRSQLVRNLAELAFAPMQASLGRALVWSPDGDHAFTLAAPSIDDRALVRMEVDEQGDIRSARASDRPRENGHGGFLHEPYRLDFDGHERLPSGVRIPSRATGTFETAGGDWRYWRFEVVDAG